MDHTLQAELGETIFVVFPGERQVDWDSINDDYRDDCQLTLGEVAPISTCIHIFFAKIVLKMQISFQSGWGRACISTKLLVVWMPLVPCTF